ncbi:RYamide receptor-like [Liolophura sinensis]|uniref:RYamide receptor-like n=1 Tax=Liolophura sinensis TaxID=3198878 RepID=UPI0031586DED
METAHVRNLTDMNASLSESPQTGLEGVWAHIAVLSVLTIAILSLNVCVIHAIMKNKHLRTGSNSLIVSLAVADICIALFVIPGHISRNFSERYMGNILCVFCSYSSSVSMAAAAFSLCAISLVRVRAVAYPLKPKFSKRDAGFVIVPLWLVALVYGLRGGLTFSLRDVTLLNGVNRTICTMNSADVVNEGVAAVELVVIFILPAIVVCVSYAVILYLISQHNRRMNGGDENKVIINRTNNTGVKAVRVSILMVSIFVVCHLPTNVVMMYVSSGVELFPQIAILVRAFYIIAFINSVLNPICYGFFNPNIRRGLYKACSACCCCRRINTRQ